MHLVKECHIKQLLLLLLKLKVKPTAKGIHIMRQEFGTSPTLEMGGGGELVKSQLISIASPCPPPGRVGAMIINDLCIWSFQDSLLSWKHCSWVNIP